MTFDETRRYLIGNFEDMNLEAVISILNSLREEYAPTIEMNEMQMKQMMSFKEFNAGFSTFMYKQGLGELPAFNYFITTQRENELMQAWLHKETIKVVDE